MSGTGEEKLTFTQLRILASILLMTQKKALYIMVGGQLCIVLLYEVSNSLIYAILSVLRSL